MAVHHRIETSPSPWKVQLESQNTWSPSISLKQPPLPSENRWTWCWRPSSAHAAVDRNISSKTCQRVTGLRRGCWDMQTISTRYHQMTQKLRYTQISIGLTNFSSRLPPHPSKLKYFYRSMGQDIITYLTLPFTKWHREMEHEVVTGYSSVNAVFAGAHLQGGLSWIESSTA